METGYKYRDALRLLFILQHGSHLLDVMDASGATRVFEGEKRLHAINFWVRNPDYLAEALLDQYDQTAEPDLLDEVKAIFDNEEPSVRLVKMLRWKRGAFENIEDALAVLSSRRLIHTAKVPISNGKFQHNFYVYPTAETFLREAIEDQPTLVWYRERVALTMRVAGDGSGYALKAEQYLNPEYKDTTLGAFIPSIQERVRKRLVEYLEVVA
jgi:hypothetical protein